MTLKFFIGLLFVLLLICSIAAGVQAWSLLRKPQRRGTLRK